TGQQWTPLEPSWPPEVAHDPTAEPNGVVAQEWRHAAQGPPPVAGADVPCHPVEQPLSVVGLHGTDPHLERRAFVVVLAPKSTVPPTDRHRRSQHVARIAALTFRVHAIVEDDLAVTVDPPSSGNTDIQIEVGRAS